MEPIRPSVHPFIRGSFDVYHHSELSLSRLTAVRGGLSAEHRSRGGGVGEKKFTFLRRVAPPTFTLLWAPGTVRLVTACIL